MNAELNNIFKEKKVCVIVPTYNNAKTLTRVLENIMKYTNQVVVVNDGSTDQTEELLMAFSSITLISYPENKGKGFAIRQGFKRAVELGFDYAITIDSDGQHYADDLSQFIEALPANPASIIIGARNMEQSSVPGKSSFGNKFSNFWFWVETGLRMRDTQSGYRLYPIHLLKDIRFITKKFEFEIEVLVRSAWKGIAIAEVPVRVFYAEKENRVSHFRPFVDFTRISILNTVLVTLALVYIKPRDFIRNIKKKTFGETFATYSSTRKRLFQLRQSR